MTDFSDYSLKFTGLKCFDSEPQGFETIKPVNLIIGRNNSGKSTLLDLFPALVREQYSPPSFLSRNLGTDVNAYLSVSLTAEMIEKGFHSKDSGGHYGHFANHGHFSSKLVDKIATVRYSSDRFEFVSLEDEPEITRRLSGNWEADFHHRVTRCVQNPFRNHTFHRIHPERSLKPEPDQSTDVFGDGTGGTNQIQQFLNLDHLPRELVREKLLDQLNQIVNPDSEFTEITTMRINQSDRWEVFLREPRKGLIPLSRSGQGLQTIILVLIHTILLTHETDDLSNHIFGFEELENNLHPALFRRLLSHIRNLATESGGTFLLTTHSHVAIDLFRRDKDAQIVHVTHDGASATCRTLTTYIEHNGLLDDLDVRASDILQANCVIWVEGPSDRIYINHWISLFSEGQLEEGFHYQCVFYGGRLLSHLTADDPDRTEVDEAIKIFRLNRRAYLVMDSDKRNQQTPINGTKKRVQEEIQAQGGAAWITKGKEIENYLPADAVEEALELRNLQKWDQYDDVFALIEKAKCGVGEKMRKKKPLLAEKVISHIDAQNWRVFDLETKIQELCQAIRCWNQIREE